MGEWQKVEIRKKGTCPCDVCNAGWCSVSSKTEDGEAYIKSDSCTETCVRYKMWREKDRIQGGCGTFNLAGGAFLLCHMKDGLVDDGFGTAASAVCERCGERLSISSAQEI